MPDLEPAIPQRVQHGADQRLNGFIHPRLKEKHQIDIRLGSQFPAAVPP